MAVVQHDDDAWVVGVAADAAAVVVRDDGGERCGLLVDDEDENDGDEQQQQQQQHEKDDDGDVVLLQVTAYRDCDTEGVEVEWGDKLVAALWNPLQILQCDEVDVEEHAMYGVASFPKFVRLLVLLMARAWLCCSHDVKK